jgi:hypothetical protein
VLLLLPLLTGAGGLLSHAADVFSRAPATGQPECRMSIVGENGMPKNIVPKGAAWNFGPGSLWTHKGWQYAAYWDDARQVSVARRQLPSGTWSIVSLPGYQRTATENRGTAGPVARGFGDGHEKVSMGISPDGVIHLAFDHHMSTLHYRTSKPGVANDPAAHAWTADLFGPVQDNLGGLKLVSVTYPGFTSDGVHFTLYLRMGGGSGSGNSHFFEYDAGRWRINTEPASKLIDRLCSGGDGTVNAYPHALVIANGRRHLTWCWRDTPDASTNHDLCYAYSDDDGAIWCNNEGKKIAATGSSYITADTPGITVWPIPPGTQFLNGGSMTVDNEGRVHVLMRGEDGSPVHFQRDPANGKWAREKFPVLGSLVPGQGDNLYVVSPDGLQCTSASRSSQPETLVTGQAHFFADSTMGIDATRVAQDGWVSVIGQNGKTVTVLDYWVGK